MRFGVTLGAAALAAVVGMAATVASAQDAGKKVSPNPVGAGWGNTTVTQSGNAAGSFTPEQTAAIERVSNYFDTLTTLAGRFVQTDPDGTKTKGKFYVKRPGKFRFEYARPSTKVVVSDGRFLAIEESDANTEETYELNDTPFRMILRQDVNLLRDAQVLQVAESDSQIELVLKDKDPDVGAAIKIVMTKGEELVLRGWITRDAQGLETTVEATDLASGGSLDDDLFERGQLFRKKLRN